MNGSKDGEDKFCILCKKKDPPVYTRLILGVNISQKRLESEKWYCNDCNRERHRGYNDGKVAARKEQRHLEAIEELTQAWNDPAYKHIKEISDKVVKVWDKNDWRTKERGFRWEWICEVLFPDMWNIDPNTSVEDYFVDKHISKTIRSAQKTTLLGFATYTIELLTLGLRQKAKNKWMSIVAKIAKNYHGREKMIADPAYHDPVTKENIPQWYLLSKEQDRKEREAKKEARKIILDNNINDEKTIISAREALEQREKAKNQSAEQEKDSSSNESKEGGE